MKENKVTCFIFTLGMPETIVCLDHVLKNLPKNTTKLRFGVVFESERVYNWFKKIVEFLDLEFEVIVNPCQNLFFGLLSRRLFKSPVSIPKGNMDFFKVFYSGLIEIYLKNASNKKIFICLPKDYMLFDLKKYPNCEFFYPDSPISWKKFLDSKQDLAEELRSGISDYYAFLKLYLSQEILEKAKMQDFISVLSPSARRKLFFILAEASQGLTLRKIQENMKKQGKAISLAGLLKHLNELMSQGLVYKNRKKEYFAKFKDIKITLSRTVF